MIPIQINREEVDKALGMTLNDTQWNQFKYKVEHGFPYSLVLRHWQDMIVFERGIFAVQNWNAGLKNLMKSEEKEIRQDEKKQRLGGKG